MSEVDPTQIQVGPGEGVVGVQLPQAGPRGQDHLSAGGTLEELEEQPLGRTVPVRHLQQDGQQRDRTPHRDQQGAVHVQHRTDAVDWGETNLYSDGTQDNFLWTVFTFLYLINHKIKVFSVFYNSFIL